MKRIRVGNRQTIETMKYYDHTKIEDLRNRYKQIEFFTHRLGSVEDLRKKQVLDTIRLLGFDEGKIKKVEEALTKYKTVDDAMEEIRNATGSTPIYRKMVSRCLS